MTKLERLVAKVERFVQTQNDRETDNFLREHGVDPRTGRKISSSGYRCRREIKQRAFESQIRLQPATRFV